MADNPPETKQNSAVSQVHFCKGRSPMDFDNWYEKERLHRAAQSGDVRQIKALLEEGLAINAFDDDLSRTPLHYAAIEGHIDAVRYLLEAGADVNAHEE